MRPTLAPPLSPIVELRQYDLVPGSRDTLIDLFDRRLIEGQEAEGMTIIGQFRDLDNPGQLRAGDAASPTWRRDARPWTASMQVRSGWPTAMPPMRR